MRKIVIAVAVLIVGFASAVPHEALKSVLAQKGYQNVGQSAPSN
jgi:hypothetical protein